MTNVNNAKRANVNYCVLDNSLFISSSLGLAHEAGLSGDHG